MVSLLLNYSPIFVMGELMLALSLGMFGFALVGTVREKYSIEVPGPRNSLTTDVRRPHPSP